MDTTPVIDLNPPVECALFENGSELPIPRVPFPLGLTPEIAGCNLGITITFRSNREFHCSPDEIRFFGPHHKGTLPIIEPRAIYLEPDDTINVPTKLTPA